MTPAWMNRAACAGLPGDEWFANEYTEQHRIAVRICNECPVRRDCLEHALRNREEEGVWGGLTQRQRRLELRRRRRDAREKVA